MCLKALIHYSHLLTPATFQPARDPYEENSTIEHTSEGIFFRITRDISAGGEILAWFSESTVKKAEESDELVSPGTIHLYILYFTFIL